MTQQPWGNPPSQPQGRPQGVPGWNQPRPSGLRQQAPWPAQQGSPWATGTPQAWQQQAYRAPAQQQGGWPAPGQAAWPAPTQQGPVVPTPQKAPRRGGRIILLALLMVGVLLASATITSFIAGGGSTGTSTSGTTEEPYKNATYTAPPPDKSPAELPVPQTYEEAAQLMTANALYDQQVQVPVACEATDIDLATASTAQLQAHMNDVVACLMRSWVDPVQGAGYQLPRPSVTIYDTQIQTACGKLPTHNAVYCAADQQVYYASDLPDVMPSDLAGRRWTVEAVVAHEFGHAVQARTAILISEAATAQKSKSKTVQNQYSRRLELQADCFAGTFLHSIARSKSMDDGDLATIKGMFYSFGDDVLTGQADYDGNHGHGASRQAWTEAGLGASTFASCNSFTADASTVR